MSVDDFAIITDVMSVCATESAGPSPVPAGSVTVGRAAGASTAIDVTWDAGSCAAADYNLLYGDLGNVSSYALSGSECAIGTTGNYMWSAVPPGDLYFLIVGTDGSGIESSWGVNSFVGERNGMVPSGLCSAVTKDISTSCP